LLNFPKRGADVRSEAVGLQPIRLGSLIEAPALRRARVLFCAHIEEELATDGAPKCTDEKENLGCGW
jgi:hypothetical protein